MMGWLNSPLSSILGLLVLTIFALAIITTVGDYYYKKDNPAEYHSLGNKKLIDYKLVVDTTYGSRSTHTERYSVFYFEDGTVYEIKKPCIHIDKIKIGSYYNLSYVKHADTIDEYKWGCRNAYVFDSLQINNQKPGGKPQ